MLTALLAFFHRKNGISSSGLMFFFWFFLVLFAIPQYRTEIVYYIERRDREELTFGAGALSWDDYQFLSYMIYFPLTVFQLVSQLFADKPPTETFYEEPDKGNFPNPEIQSSFIRKLLFIWFDPMTWKGFRQPLTNDDMWDIRPDDTSREMVPDFDRYWAESVAKGERQRQKEKLKKNSKDKNLDSKSTRVSLTVRRFLASTQSETQPHFNFISGKRNYSTLQDIRWSILLRWLPQIVDRFIVFRITSSAEVDFHFCDSISTSFSKMSFYQQFAHHIHVYNRSVVARNDFRRRLVPNIFHYVAFERSVLIPKFLSWLQDSKCFDQCHLPEGPNHFECSETRHNRW